MTQTVPILAINPQLDLPVLEAVHDAVPLPISVDTTKAAVARRAIQAGATIVNDITALRGDPLMASLVSETGAAVVLMHMQGTPQTMQQSPPYTNVVEEVLAFLREQVQVAIACGIKGSQIVLDPGSVLVSSKSITFNCSLSLTPSRSWPVLAGVSRKQFIGNLTQQPIQERGYGTAGAVAVAVLKGARIIRVHDVRSMRDTVSVVSAISRHARSHVGVSNA